MATISARAMFPVLDALRHAGIDALPLMGAAGLDPSIFEDGDRRVSVLASDRLWATAREALDDPELGLRIAASVGPSSYGLVTYLVAASRTWGESLGRLCRYYPVLSEGVRYTLEVEGGVASLRARLLGRPAVVPEIEQFTVAVAYEFSRRHCARPFVTRRVCFRHPPHAVTAVGAFFDGPVEFEMPWNGFEVPAGDLDIALRAGEPGLAEILEIHAQDLLKRGRPEERDEEVRTVLALAVSEGERPTVTGVAKNLGMAPRSLRRKLAERGTNFQAELDAVRAEMAKVALLELDLREVALRLGFADTSSFSKAFRRWTGMTPGAFKSAMRPPKAPGI